MLTGIIKASEQALGFEIQDALYVINQEMSRL
jgi:hypothetical protein